MSRYSKNLPLFDDLNLRREEEKRREEKRMGEVTRLAYTQNCQPLVGFLSQAQQVQERDISVEIHSVYHMLYSALHRPPRFKM